METQNSQPQQFHDPVAVLKWIPSTRTFELLITAFQASPDISELLNQFTRSELTLPTLLTKVYPLVKPHPPVFFDYLLYSIVFHFASNSNLLITSSLTPLLKHLEYSAAQPSYDLTNIPPHIAHLSYQLTTFADTLAILQANQSTSDPGLLQIEQERLQLTFAQCVVGPLDHARQKINQIGQKEDEVSLYASLLRNLANKSIPFPIPYEPYINLTYTSLMTSIATQRTRQYHQLIQNYLLQSNSPHFQTFQSFQYSPEITQIVEALKHNLPPELAENQASRQFYDIQLSIAISQLIQTDFVPISPFPVKLEALRKQCQEQQRNLAQNSQNPSPSDPPDPSSTQPTQSTSTTTSIDHHHDFSSLLTQINDNSAGTFIGFTDPTPFNTFPQPTFFTPNPANSAQNDTNSENSLETATTTAADLAENTPPGQDNEFTTVIEREIAQFIISAQKNGSTVDNIEPKGVQLTETTMNDAEVRSAVTGTKMDQNEIKNVKIQHLVPSVPQSFQFTAPYTPTSLLIQIATNPIISDYIDATYSPHSHFHTQNAHKFAQTITATSSPSTNTPTTKTAQNTQISENRENALKSGTFDQLKRFHEIEAKTSTQIAFSDIIPRFSHVKSYILDVLNEELLRLEDRIDNADPFQSFHANQLKFPETPEEVLSCIIFSPEDIRIIVNELGIVFYTNEVILSMFRIKKVDIWKHLRRIEFLYTIGYPAALLNNVDLYTQYVFDNLPVDWYCLPLKKKNDIFLYLHFELYNSMLEQRSAVFSNTLQIDTYLDQVQYQNKQSWNTSTTASPDSTDSTSPNVVFSPPTAANRFFSTDAAKFQQLYHTLLIKQAEMEKRYNSSQLQFAAMLSTDLHSLDTTNAVDSVDSADQRNSQQQFVKTPTSPSFFTNLASDSALFADSTATSTSGFVPTNSFEDNYEFHKLRHRAKVENDDYFLQQARSAFTMLPMLEGTNHPTSLLPHFPDTPAALLRDQLIRDHIDPKDYNYRQMQAVSLVNGRNEAHIDPKTQNQSQSQNSFTDRSSSVENESTAGNTQRSKHSKAVEARAMSFTSAFKNNYNIVTNQHDLPFHVPKSHNDINGATHQHFTTTMDPETRQPHQIPISYQLPSYLTLFSQASMQSITKQPHAFLADYHKLTYYRPFFERITQSPGLESLSNIFFRTALFSPDSQSFLSFTSELPNYITSLLWKNFVNLLHLYNVGILSRTELLVQTRDVLTSPILHSRFCIAIGQNGYYDSHLLNAFHLSALKGRFSLNITSYANRALLAHSSPKAVLKYHLDLYRQSQILYTNQQRKNFVKWHESHYKHYQSLLLLGKCIFEHIVRTKYPELVQKYEKEAILTSRVAQSGSNSPPTAPVLSQQLYLNVLTDQIEFVSEKDANAHQNPPLSIKQLYTPAELSLLYYLLETTQSIEDKSIDDQSPGKQQNPTNSAQNAATVTSKKTNKTSKISPFHPSFALKHSYRLMMGSDERLLNPNLFVSSDLVDYYQYFKAINFDIDGVRASPSYYTLPDYLEKPMTSTYSFLQRKELSAIMHEQATFECQNLQSWYQRKYNSLVALFERKIEKGVNSGSNVDIWKDIAKLNGVNGGSDGCAHTGVVSIEKIHKYTMSVFSGHLDDFEVKMSSTNNPNKSKKRHVQNSRNDTEDHIAITLRSPLELRASKNVILASRTGEGYPYSLLDVLSDNYLSSQPSESELVSLYKNAAQREDFRLQRKITTQGGHTASMSIGLTTSPSKNDHNNNNNNNNHKLSRNSHSITRAYQNNLLMDSYNPRLSPIRQQRQLLADLQNHLESSKIQYEMGHSYFKRLHTKISLLPTVNQQFYVLGDQIPDRYLKLLHTFYHNQIDGYKLSTQLVETPVVTIPLVLHRIEHHLTMLSQLKTNLTYAWSKLHTSMHANIVYNFHHNTSPRHDEHKLRNARLLIQEIRDKWVNLSAGTEKELFYTSTPASCPSGYSVEFLARTHEVSYQMHLTEVAEEKEKSRQIEASMSTVQTMGVDSNTPTTAGNTAGQIEDQTETTDHLCFCSPTQQYVDLYKHHYWVANKGSPYQNSNPRPNAIIAINETFNFDNFSSKANKFWYKLQIPLTELSKHEYTSLLTLCNLSGISSPPPLSLLVSTGFTFLQNNYTLNNIITSSFTAFTPADNYVEQIINSYSGLETPSAGAVTFVNDLYLYKQHQLSSLINKSANAVNASGSNGNPMTSSSSSSDMSLTTTNTNSSEGGVGDSNTALNIQQLLEELQNTPASDLYSPFTPLANIYRLHSDEYQLISSAISFDPVFATNTPNNLSTASEYGFSTYDDANPQLAGNPHDILLNSLKADKIDDKNSTRTSTKSDTRPSPNGVGGASDNHEKKEKGTKGADFDEKQAYELLSKYSPLSTTVPGPLQLDYNCQRCNGYTRCAQHYQIRYQTPSVLSHLYCFVFLAHTIMAMPNVNEGMMVSILEYIIYVVWKQQLALPPELITIGEKLLINLVTQFEEKFHAETQLFAQLLNTIRVTAHKKSGAPVSKFDANFEAQNPLPQTQQTLLTDSDKNAICDAKTGPKTVAQLNSQAPGSSALFSGEYYYEYEEFLPPIDSTDNSNYALTLLKGKLFDKMQFFKKGSNASKTAALKQAKEITTLANGHNSVAPFLQQQHTTQWKKNDRYVERFSNLYENLHFSIADEILEDGPMAGILTNYATIAYVNANLQNADSDTKDKDDIRAMFAGYDMSPHGLSRMSRGADGSGSRMGLETTADKNCEIDRVSTAQSGLQGVMGQQLGEMYLTNAQLADLIRKHGIAPQSIIPYSNTAESLREQQLDSNTTSSPSPTAVPILTAHPTLIHAAGSLQPRQNSQSSEPWSNLAAFTNLHHKLSIQSEHVFSHPAQPSPTSTSTSTPQSSQSPQQLQPHTLAVYPMLTTSSMYFALRLYLQLYERIFPLVLSQTAYHSPTALGADKSEYIDPETGLVRLMQDDDLITEINQPRPYHSETHLHSFEWLTYHLLHNKIPELLYEYECTLLFGQAFTKSFFNMQRACIQFVKQVYNIVSNVSGLKCIALYDMFILSSQLHSLQVNHSTFPIQPYYQHISSYPSKYTSSSTPSSTRISDLTSISTTLTVPTPTDDSINTYLMHQYSTLCFYELQEDFLVKIATLPHSRIVAMGYVENITYRPNDGLITPQIHYSTMFQSIFSDKDFSWDVYKHIFHHLILTLQHHWKKSGSYVPSTPSNSKKPQKIEEINFGTKAPTPTSNSGETSEMFDQSQLRAIVDESLSGIRVDVATKNVLLALQKYMSNPSTIINLLTNNANSFSDLAYKDKVVVFNQPIGRVLPSSSTNAAGSDIISPSASAPSTTTQISQNRGLTANKYPSTIDKSDKPYLINKFLNVKTLGGHLDPTTLAPIPITPPQTTTDSTSEENKPAAPKTQSKTAAAVFWRQKEEMKAIVAYITSMLNAYPASNTTTTTTNAASTDLTMGKNDETSSSDGRLEKNDKISPIFDPNNKQGVISGPFTPSANPSEPQFAVGYVRKPFLTRNVTKVMKHMLKHRQTDIYNYCISYDNNIFTYHLNEHKPGLQQSVRAFNDATILALQHSVPSYPNNRMFFSRLIPFSEQKSAFNQALLEANLNNGNTPGSMSDDVGNTTGNAQTQATKRKRKNSANSSVSLSLPSSTPNISGLVNDVNVSGFAYVDEEELFQVKKQRPNNSYHYAANSTAALSAQSSNGMVPVAQLARKLYTNSFENPAQPTILQETVDSVTFAETPSVLTGLNTKPGQKIVKDGDYKIVIKQHFRPFDSNRSDNALDDQSTANPPNPPNSAVRPGTIINNTIVTPKTEVHLPPDLTTDPRYARFEEKLASIHAKTHGPFGSGGLAIDADFIRRQNQEFVDVWNRFRLPPQVFTPRGIEHAATKRQKNGNKH